MNKYIDAEKLIAAIETRLKNIRDYINGAGMKYHGPKFYKARGKESAYDALLSIVYFLQQEQQEQPELDLEKFTEKIKTFQGRYKYPEILSIKGAMAFMARMFYQYPNIARQWYDSLPKTTMD